MQIIFLIKSFIYFQCIFIYRALQKWGSEEAIKLRRLIIKREMDRKGGNDIPDSVNFSCKRLVKNYNCKHMQAQRFNHAVQAFKMLSYRE